MATLCEYVDREGFYVRHTFASKGRVYLITYQVTDKAASVFIQKSIACGMEIPKGLLKELINSGDLYTQKSGVNGEPLSCDEEKESNQNIFKGLSEEARWWITDMLISHPQIRAKIDKEANQMEFDDIPENYMQQLVNVARVVDGTEFFTNLRMSQESIFKSQIITGKNNK
jgi:hypothetical protein